MIGKKYLVGIIYFDKIEKILFFLSVFIISVNDATLLFIHGD